MSAKLKATDMPRISQLISEGKGYEEIARMYGVARQSIYSLVIGRNWKGVYKGPFWIPKVPGMPGAKTRYTDEDRELMRALYQEGLSLSEIARKWECARETVTRAVYETYPKRNVSVSTDAHTGRDSEQAGGELRHGAPLVCGDGYNQLQSGIRRESSDSESGLGRMVAE
jgi:transposase-like protein